MAFRYVASQFAAGVLLLLQAPTVAQDGKWRMAKPLPKPAGEIVSTVVGSKCMCFVGFVGRAGAKGWGPVANAFEYESGADTKFESIINLKTAEEQASQCRARFLFALTT